MNPTLPRSPRVQIAVHAAPAWLPVVFALLPLLSAAPAFAESVTIAGRLVQGNAASPIELGGHRALATMAEAASDETASSFVALGNTDTNGGFEGTIDGPVPGVVTLRVEVDGVDYMARAEVEPGESSVWIDLPVYPIDAGFGAARCVYEVVDVTAYQISESVTLDITVTWYLRNAGDTTVLTWPLELGRPLAQTAVLVPGGAVHSLPPITDAFAAFRSADGADPQLPSRALLNATTDTFVFLPFPIRPSGAQLEDPATLIGAALVPGLIAVSVRDFIRVPLRAPVELRRTLALPVDGAGRTILRVQSGIDVVAAEGDRAVDPATLTALPSALRDRSFIERPLAQEASFVVTVNDPGPNQMGDSGGSSQTMPSGHPPTDDGGGTGGQRMPSSMPGAGDTHEDEEDDRALPGADIGVAFFGVCLALAILFWVGRHRQKRYAETRPVADMKDDELMDLARTLTHDPDAVDLEPDDREHLREACIEELARRRAGL